jgi:hypothetical protein
MGDTSDAFLATLDPRLQHEARRQMYAGGRMSGEVRRELERWLYTEETLRRLPPAPHADPPQHTLHTPCM